MECVYRRTVYEYLVGELFKRRGYWVGYTQASGDEGVDLTLRQGIKKGVVQCKRYGHSVGQPVVRDLYGTMLHTKSREAWLVTTAIITRQAQEWAKGKPIHLVDGYKLATWIAETRGINPGRWLRLALPGVLLAGVLTWGVAFDGFSTVGALLPSSLPDLPTLRQEYHYYLPVVYRNAG